MKMQKEKQAVLNKRKARIWNVVALCLVTTMLLGGCRREGSGASVDRADAIERTDFTSVYDKIGRDVMIDMVVERDGLAYVTVDGVEYELGMDFLSMAMVYNTQVPPGESEYDTEKEVYDAWWRLYVMRWNYLVPEIPLYSNVYYDLYHAKLENFKTTPYRSAADAIVGARVKEGYTNAVTLGSATELSGAFRNAAWGKSAPLSSDLDVQGLVSGHSIVMTDEAGNYVWNEHALSRQPDKRYNEDGTLTYTISIKPDLKFSDGSPINARHYLAQLLCNSSPIGVAAGGSGSQGNTLLGFEAFKAYDGTNEGQVIPGREGADIVVSRYFSGVRLLADLTFEVTFDKEYAAYYYSMMYAAYSPDPLALYLGDGEIVVDPASGACGLSDAFYEKRTENGVEVFRVAATIRQNLRWDSPLPYAGPYRVTAYGNGSATLTRNPHYGGDVRGTASIDTIDYVRIVTETQLDQFKTGQIDVLAGITGGSETEAALALLRSSPDRYAEVHYDRAGYGKIGFRADFGPSGFSEVRRAIMHTINRPAFAQTFTGGHGSVVHGPYYTGFSSYVANREALERDLNRYAYDTDAAIQQLVAGGWIYNERGEAYDASRDAVRYKKLEGYERSWVNLNFASTDRRYRTVKVGEDYYMPLVINWYGTQPNPVTDQLLTDWQSSESATRRIGMVITYTSTDFPGGMAELTWDTGAGFSGTPRLNALNFASGFSSAAYDFSFNWSIDPEREVLSVCYLKDAADFYSDYHTKQ